MKKKKSLNNYENREIDNKERTENRSYLKQYSLQESTQLEKMIGKREITINVQPTSLHVKIFGNKACLETLKDNRRF